MGANVKALSDLIAKASRLNKDRQITGDLLEMSRQVKGLEQEINTLNALRTTLANEIVKLKRELTQLKGGSAQPVAPQPVEPAPQPGQRVADGFVWKKS